MPQSRSNESFAQPPEADTADVRAARGDPQAFARLYNRYVKPVYRYLRSRVESPEEAGDLTAQTFLAAMESLRCYDHRGYFSAWLFSIARRKAADSFRQRQNLPLEEAEWVAAETDLPDETVRTDQIDALKQLIRPDACEVVGLSDIKGEIRSWIEQP